MARRLLIAFVLIAVLSVVCWIVLPRTGLGLPWYVPLVGYAVIVGGVLLPVFERWSEEPEKPRPGRLTPDPGPGEEDLERFGEPRLRLTDREDERR